LVKLVRFGRVEQALPDYHHLLVALLMAIDVEEREAELVQHFWGLGDIVDELEEEVGRGVAEYLNCAPLSTEAVRVVLEREVLRGIVHPQVDLDTGLRGGHARVVHIARPARCRECDRLVRAQTSCRAVAVFIGVSDFAYAGVATEAAQVGVGHSGLSKVERRDARGGLSQAPSAGRS